MDKLSCSQFIRRSNQVVWKVIEDKGIVLNLEDGAYFEVNPVGLEIWKVCDGKTSLEKIAERIAKTFHADPERTCRDTFAFVSELRRRKLVEASERPAAAVARP